MRSFVVATLFIAVSTGSALSTAMPPQREGAREAAFIVDRQYRMENNGQWVSLPLGAVYLDIRLSKPTQEGVRWHLVRSGDLGVPVVRYEEGIESFSWPIDDPALVRKHQEIVISKRNGEVPTGEVFSLQVDVTDPPDAGAEMRTLQMLTIADIGTHLVSTLDENQISIRLDTLLHSGYFWRVDDHGGLGDPVTTAQPTSHSDTAPVTDVFSWIPSDPALVGDHLVVVSEYRKIGSETTATGKKATFRITVQQ